MKLWRPKNFYESLLPLYFLKTMLGCSVFYYPLHKPRMKLTVFYGCFMLLLTWGNFYRAYKEGVDPQWYLKSEAVWLISMIFYNAQMGVIVVTTWFKRKSEERILLKSSAIEDTLQLLGIRTNFSQIVGQQLIFVVLWGFLSLSANFCISSWRIEGFIPSFQKFFWFSSIQHAHHVNSFLEFCHFMAIRYITNRYEQINKYLSNLNVKNCEKSMKNYKIKRRKGVFKINVETADKKDPKCIVQVLKHVHLDIRRSAHELMRINSMPITILTTAGILYITAMFYILFTSVFRSSVSSPLKVKRFFIMLFALSSTALKVFLVNKISASTTIEYEKTKAVIQKLALMTDDPEFQREIKQFSYQIMANPLKFEPYGLFELGYEHMRGFVAAVTTNLIILIQHEQV